MSEQKRRLHFRGRQTSSAFVQLVTVNYKLKKQGLEPLPTLADEGARERLAALVGRLLTSPLEA
jgi:hypothetical protein